MYWYPDFSNTILNSSSNLTEIPFAVFEDLLILKFVPLFLGFRNWNL